MARQGLGEVSETGQNACCSRGVAPVISVILLVAIAVILGAVIATVALGLGEDTSDTGPSVAFSESINNDTGTITITHASGDVIEAGNLRLEGAILGEKEPFEGETVKAGDSTTLFAGAGEEISIVWESNETTRSFLLETYDVSDVFAGEKFTLNTSTSDPFVFDCTVGIYDRIEIELTSIRSSQNQYITDTATGNIRKYDTSGGSATGRQWPDKEVGDSVTDGTSGADPVVIDEIDTANDEVTFVWQKVGQCR